MNYIKSTRMIFGFLMAILSLISCKKKHDVPAELSVSPSAITFPAEGGASDITVTCNAKWSVNNPAYTWLQTSQATGNSGTATIHLTTLGPNGTGAGRSVYFEVSSSNGQVRRVTITQPPTIYPSYNTSPKAPDTSGMSS